MVGRNPDYDTRTTVNISCEGSLKQQFKKICQRKGVDMNSLFQEWMHDYIAEHKDDQYASIDNFFDPIQEVAKTPEKEHLILTVDLDSVDKPKLVAFIHSLNQQHAAVIQGLGSMFQSVGKLVVQQRKIGIPARRRT